MQGEEEPNAYEQQRAQRVQQNARRLEELGLLANPLSGAAEATRAAGRAQRRAQRAVEEAQLEPTRRSRRQRGEVVESVGMENHPDNPGGSRQPRECGSSRPRAQAADLEALDAGGGDPALHDHNLMRIRSMSTRALQTRIWKIRRVDKLHSFVKVLEACGMADLAAEAREALQQMTGMGEEQLAELVP